MRLLRLLLTIIKWSRRLLNNRRWWYELKIVIDNQYIKWLYNLETESNNAMMEVV